MAFYSFIKELLDMISNTENWSVDSILSAISIIMVIIGGLFAFTRWNASNQIKRTELIKQIIEQLRFDKEMTATMYIIEYDDSWYDKDFHNNNSDFEHQVDKLLSYLSYICYLKKENNIRKREFRILQYEINRTCTSPCAQAYLWNLYHFSLKQGSNCSFQYLIDYGIKHKLIDKLFLKDDCELYTKTLNF